MSELSREARDLIESAAHADDPSEADRKRLRARLAAQLGAVAVASTMGAASSTMVSASAGSVATNASSLSVPAAGALQGAVGLTLFKLVIATGLAGVIGGSVTWFALQRDAAGPTATLPVHGAGAAEERLAEPASAALLRPTVEPLTVMPVEAPGSAAKPRALSSDGLPRESAHLESRKAATADGDQGSLSAELALLAKAQQALRDGEPALALTHAEEHHRRFPRGRLGEERLGIQALARCALGDDGAEAIAALTRLSPNSPLLSRVRAACEQSQ
jgi:hypothetical protein